MSLSGEYGEHPCSDDGDICHQGDGEQPCNGDEGICHWEMESMPAMVVEDIHDVSF